MGNAIWLLLALPKWYLSTVMAPLSGGLLTLLPALGTLCLAVGIAIGMTKRQRRLLHFLTPFALSETFVAIAGALRGQVTGPEGGVILLIFIVAQLLVSGYLVYNSKGARVPATALAIFSITYAAFRAFVAGMSFSDNWL